MCSPKILYADSLLLHPSQRSTGEERVQGQRRFQINQRERTSQSQLIS